MTNEELAKEFCKKLSCDDSIHYDRTVVILQSMAEWKDQQFKEYLEKKKASFVRGDYGTRVIDEIINELFKED